MTRVFLYMCLLANQFNKWVCRCAEQVILRWLIPRQGAPCWHVAAVPRGGVCIASCLASVRRVGSLAEMRPVQVACILVVACGLVAARAHSSHVAGTVHVSGLRRVRAGAVERFGRGSLPLLRLQGGEEQEDGGEGRAAHGGGVGARPRGSKRERREAWTTPTRWFIG